MARPTDRSESADVATRQSIIPAIPHICIRLADPVPFLQYFVPARLRITGGVSSRRREVAREEAESRWRS
jgi:hypothetical protein